MQDLKLASIYRRGFAFIIDEIIISFFRILLISSIYLLFFKSQLQELNNTVYLSIINLSENSTIMDIFNTLKDLEITNWIIRFSILFIAVSPIYQIYCYHFKSGQTKGKKFMGIIVLKSDQTKITIGDIFARVILSYIPWILPVAIYELYNIGNILYLPCLILWFFWYDPWILFGERHKTIHDLMSGTYVFILPEENITHVKDDEKNISY